MTQTNVEPHWNFETSPLLLDASSTSKPNGDDRRAKMDDSATGVVPQAPHPSLARAASPLHVNHPTSSTDEPAPSSPARLRRTPSANTVRNGEGPATPVLHKRASLSSLNSARGASSPRSPIPRRSSSNLFSAAVAPIMSPSKDLTPAVEEPTVVAAMTAATVAEEYFQKELSVHDQAAGMKPEVAVILHDACYGHRFSRPRTSKAGLSTIVERPERLLATVLGISAAYVRLGGRHMGATRPPHPTLDASAISSVPFRIVKSSRVVSLLAPAVTQVHGTKWMAELKMMCEGAEAKLAVSGKELMRPNMQSISEDGSDRPQLHEGDLYLCSESLEALEGALGGVCEAVDLVFAHAGPSRAFVSVRPPGHHCSDTYPSGFCWINNVHVGISHAAVAHGLTHAAIIDFDLHHGDGSQAITWAHNARAATLPKNAPTSKKTAIGYFSIHDINSYPCEWGDEEKVRSASLCLENAHGQSIWNIHLQPWKSDEAFWELYRQRYLVLIEKTRTYLQQQAERMRSLPHPKPKAAIFISAGFDASEWEGQGMQRHKVNVPTSFYARFTQEIVRLAQEEGLGVDGRVISVLEGGYSDRALMSGVFSHLSGLSSSEAEIATEVSSNGLGFEMGRLALASEEPRTASEPQSASSISYDPHWWSSANLADLETCANPPEVKEMAPKKPRGPINPTYSSPTQSFSAKIVSPSSSRKSTSGTFSRQPSLAGNIRPLTPPPPDVDWATASHELSKLLVPSDRQTKSHRPEDLNAEATRARRNRQSGVGIVPPPQTALEDGKKMHLRERRTRVQAEKVDDEVKQEPTAVSKASRRRTIAGATHLKDSSVKSEALDIGPSSAPFRRRSSVTSTSSAIPGGTITEPMSVVISSDHAEPSARNGRDSSHSIHKSTPSVAPQGDTLPMRKTRPSGDPKQPPKPRIPKRVTPRPLLPKEGPEKPQAGTASDEKPLSQPATIDSLSNGIKRMSIKLHVSTKEEHDQREAKKKAGRKATVAKAPKTPGTLPAPKASNDMPQAQAKLFNGPTNPPLSPSSILHSHTAVPVSSSMLGTFAEPVAQPAAFAAPTASTIPATAPVPASVPLSASATAPVPAPEPAPEPAPVQVPAPGPAPPASAPVTVPGPPSTERIVPLAKATLPIHPGTAALPSMTLENLNHTSDANQLTTQGHIPTTPQLDKHGLPRFTSTSPIVFALPTAGAARTELASRPQSITNSLAAQLPHQQQSLPSQQQDHHHHHHHHNVPLAVTNRPLKKAAASTTTPASDKIWDVPDTPERQKT